jgi:hypothetical protein
MSMGFTLGLFTTLLSRGGLLGQQVMSMGLSPFAVSFAVSFAVPPHSPSKKIDCGGGVISVVPLIAFTIGIIL